MISMTQVEYHELINDEKVLRLIHTLLTEPNAFFYSSLDPICISCLGIITQMSLYWNIEAVIIKGKKKEEVVTFHYLIFLVLLATKSFINFQETTKKTIKKASRDKLIYTLLELTRMFNESLYLKDNLLLKRLSSLKGVHIKNRARFLFMNDIVPRVVATVLTDENEFYGHSNISMIIRACKKDQATLLEAIIEHITLKQYTICEIPFKNLWPAILKELFAYKIPDNATSNTNNIILSLKAKIEKIEANKKLDASEKFEAIEKLSIYKNIRKVVTKFKKSVKLPSI